MTRVHVRSDSARYHAQHLDYCLEHGYGLRTGTLAAAHTTRITHRNAP